MAWLNRCCCCGIRGGAIAAAVFMTVLAFLGFGGQVAAMVGISVNPLQDAMDLVQKGTELNLTAVGGTGGSGAGGLGTDLIGDVGVSGVEIVAIISIILYVVQLVACLLIFVPACGAAGKSRDRRRLLLPFLIWQIVIVVSFFIACISAFAAEGKIGPKLLGQLPNIINLLLAILFEIVVYSYYQYLRDGPSGGDLKLVQGSAGYDPVAPPPAYNGNQKV